MKVKKLLHQTARGGILLLALIVAVPFLTFAQDKGKGKKDPVQEAPFEKEWLSALKWRSIGPAAMSGRITAISVYENDPTTYYVATASGGLLKTTNNGITFSHLFDDQDTVSIGDVCVAPSDRNTVWVGTGESNPRNSVSYGDGVYKSADGGKSWKNMGLKKTFQIGKILIHPTNPEIVYVGALGRLYGPNPQRGLFKTTDGGLSWEKILYVDENTGVIDMRMHPNEPNTLLVATYQRKRDGFDGNSPAVKWGSGSGLYRTTDGGKNFAKITDGIPDCKLGRIGLDWYRKDPKVVYMVLESELIGKAPKGVAAGNAYMGISNSDPAGPAQLKSVIANGPAEKAGFQVDDIVLQFGKKKVKTYKDLIDGIRSHKGGDKVKVLVKRDDKTKALNLVLGKRQGATGRAFSAYLSGQRENVQDRQGKDGWKYGGIYKSTDGGNSWKRVNSLNPRPMYFSQIRVDPNDDRYVYVLGIAVHRSRDGGKRFTSDGGRGCHADHHALWINPKDGRHMILGNDGGFYVTHDRMSNWDHINHFALGQFYHVAVDTRPLYSVYGGLQDNGTWGGPAFLLNPRGPVNSDWIRVGGGDGFRCQVDAKDPDLVYYASQNGNLQRRNFRTGESARIRPPSKKGVSYKWNWNTPFILSHHNSKIYYCAANYVFKSLDRGNKPQVISPKITRTARGSATALAESPKNPNVLYVGSDDGALWMTRDNGRKWTDILDNVGLPGPRWVTSIECSRFAEGRAYVAFDAHRSDDDEPHVYVTEDFGKTWKSLRGNLPWGSTRCLREDLTNPNLLYLGTEFGAWFSLDRGKTWNTLNTNLPTVAVHEIAQHPTAGEIVAATHGRSLWVLNVTALRQLKTDVAHKEPQLFRPSNAFRWVSKPSRGGTNQRFVGDNKPSGLEIYYSLPDATQKVSLTVTDTNGKTLRRLKASGKAGLHRVAWDLRGLVQSANAGGGRGGAARGRGGAGRGGAGRGRGGRGRTVTRTVSPGTYRVVLSVDGKETTQSFRVINDPNLPAGPAAENDQEDSRDDGNEENEWIGD